LTCTGARLERRSSYARPHLHHLRQPAELAVMQAAPAVFKRLRRFKHQAALDCGALASSGYQRAALALSPPQLPASSSLAQPLSLSPSLSLSLLPAQPAPPVQGRRQENDITPQGS